MIGTPQHFINLEYTDCVYICQKKWSLDLWYIEIALAVRPVYSFGIAALCSDIQINYWNIPGSDSTVIWATKQHIIFNKKIANSLGVSNKLIQNFALISKTPFDYTAIFKTSKHSFLSKASRDNLVSDLSFMFVLLYYSNRYLFLLFSLSFKNSLLLLLFLPFQFFI